MRRVTVEIVVDEATTTHYPICAVVVPSENLTAARTRMRTLEAEQPSAGCTAATSAAENRRRIVAAFRAHTGRFGRRTCSPRRSPVAPTGRSPGELSAGWAVHSAELGARRILVESCAQDTQDLAALTGVLARSGRPRRCGRGWDRPYAHELPWAADLIAYADTAGGQLRRAIDSPITAARAVVDKREGRATTHNVRAPGLTVLTLRQDTLEDSGPLPRRPGTAPSAVTTEPSP